MVWQDGSRVCKTLCKDNTSKSELDEMLAEQLGAVDSMEPVEFSPATAFANAVGITAFSVRPLELTKGGSAGSLTLTGVNLSSAVEIEYEDAGITTTTRTDSSTSIDLTISASAAVAAGDYWIKVDGHIYRGAIRVR